MRAGLVWYSHVVLRRLRSCRGWFRAWFVHHCVALMLVVFVVGMVLMLMLSGLDEVPGWWRQRESIRPGDAGVIERAERIENAITTQLTAMRDPDNPRWYAKVSDAQANAWLSVRLRETIETHLGDGAWTDGVERVYVRIEGDALTLGARVRHATGSAIVSARVGLELDEGGDLWAHIGRVRVGRTTVPGWAIALLGEGDLRTGRVRLGPGALELGDGRVARLAGVRISDGHIEVAMETVRLDR